MTAVRPEISTLLGEIREILTEGAPSDPYDRAKQRMDDAAKRGGLEKMVRATFSRIDAAESPEKLQGIVDYVNELIRELEEIKRAAEKKLR